MNPGSEGSDSWSGEGERDKAVIDDSESARRVSFSSSLELRLSVVCSVFTLSSDMVVKELVAVVGVWFNWSLIHRYGLEHCLVEDKLEMRIPPHHLMTGVHLTVCLIQFCPFMLPMSYIYVMDFPDHFKGVKTLKNIKYYFIKYYLWSQDQPECDFPCKTY